MASGGQQVVELVRRVVERHSDESVGQLVGIAGAGVALIVGPFVFRSGGTPLAGEVSVAAVTSVLVAVLQQFANVYLNGTGDFIVVALLAVVLLVRPSGLMGRKA